MGQFGVGVERGGGDPLKYPGLCFGGWLDRVLVSMSPDLRVFGSAIAPSSRITG